MRERVAVLSLLGAVLLAGCKPVPNFLTELEIARCQYDARCGLIAPSLEPQCEADVMTSAAVEAKQYDLVAAINAGHIRYDDGAAQTCLALLKTASCIADQSVVDCSSVLTGLVALGGTCLSVIECANGDCSTFIPGCPGTCQARFITAPCTAPCALGDHCDSATATCIPGVALGGACGNDLPCQPALTCEGNLPSLGSTTPEKLGLCGSVLPLGAPCVSDFTYRSGDPCALGLFCDEDTCAARLGIGAACSTNKACQDGLDCTGLRYDVNPSIIDQKGACAPYVEIGGPCTQNAVESGCTDDALCDQTSNTCQPLAILPWGDDCSGNNQDRCADHLTCDSSLLHCVQNTTGPVVCM